MAATTPSGATTHASQAAYTHATETGRTAREDDDEVLTKRRAGTVRERRKVGGSGQERQRDRERKRERETERQRDKERQRETER